jgi:D-alanyl-D-alanine carboxypeptidase (penicillin-binding protein 5/6)
MKTRRFFSAFFAGLLSVLLLCPAALATDPAEPSKTPEDPAAQAKAALLVERGSDTVLYSLNADERLYPSSLVKVATALMVLEAVEAGQLSLEQELPATASALSATIGARIGLKEGELMTVRDLMGCMLVVSANDASNILAEAVAGSVPAFVLRLDPRGWAVSMLVVLFAIGVALLVSRSRNTAASAGAAGEVLRSVD